MRRAVLAVSTVLLCSTGCLFSTSDDVPFQAADVATDATDARDTAIPEQDADAAVVPDAIDTPDAADDAGIDFGNPDMSFGGVCATAPTPDGTPLCNPVTREGCSPVQLCDIGIDTIEQPPQFFYECRTPRPLEVTGGLAGEDCSASSPCRWGHRCVQGSCYAYCQFEDGLGCSETEQCDVFFDADQITHFGLCVDTCGELRGL